jgi:hypothetical protein
MFPHIHCLSDIYILLKFTISKNNVIIIKTKIPFRALQLFLLWVYLMTIIPENILRTKCDIYVIIRYFIVSLG